MTATVETAVAVDRPDLLELLEAGARGHGTVHFVGEESEPTPIATIWNDAAVAAAWMADRVGGGNTVAAVLTNSRAAVTAMIGAWRAGCTVASLPLPARGTAPAVYVEQLTRFCRAAGSEQLLLDAEYAPLIGDAPLPVSTYDDVCAGVGSRAASSGVPALVQFTSGSLGVPKGIHLGLDAVGAHVTSIREALALGPGDASCSWLPLSHDMGLIGQLLTAMCAGAPEFGHHSLTLLKPEKFMANPLSWLRACSTSRATVTTVPNFALELAVRMSRRAGAMDLSALRTCIVGSESVRVDTLARFTEAFAGAGFHDLAFCPAYGMAEATLAITIVRPSDPWRAISHTDPDRDGAEPTSLVSTGAPINGVEVRVAAPDGQAGTIEFRSTSQLSRYIGADLELTSDGYFVTGDLGLIERGELFVLGRSDEVIVVAGCNLYPADIEPVIEHEAVRPGCLAAVVAPQGGMAIVAEPSSTKLSADDLEAACRKIRATVAASTGTSPATVAFVGRGTLPKTPSGKLRRRTIAQLLAAGDGVMTRVDFK